MKGSPVSLDQFLGDWYRFTVFVGSEPGNHGIGNAYSGVCMYDLLPEHC